MSHRILCIEDNPDNMMLLRRILESDGHSLFLAQTGLGGLELAEREDVELILLDINLPDIDGLEVTRRMRASQKSKLATVPIIIISANAMKGDAQRAIEAGSNLYMTKPIDIQKLLGQVNQYLSIPNN